MTDISNPDDAIAHVGDLAAEAARLAAEPGTALVPSGVDQAAAVKAGMVERRAVLLRQQQQVEKAAADAKALVEAQVKDMQRRLAEQLALLEPAMKQLKLLEDGVDALNIYLGRDEEIIPVREGERAPADEVISVRQQVLAMDEESLIAVDKDGMDFRDIGAFVDWLARSDENLDQIIPERKAVVAIIPRRAEKRYEDPWTAMQAGEQNRQTWWVIRNGENVWLTTTAFTVGNTTVPSSKEFTDLFIQPSRFGRPAEKLIPGTPEWVRAEESADARTRHYMKVALLLQGLLDRTTVFHPHQGVSFLDQDHYDRGLVRVILDGENALTDGRLPFKEWRAERVAKMHPGMRVIGAFAARMRMSSSRDYDADVRPQHAKPQSMTPYTVRATSRSYYDWEFSFARTDLVWDDDAWEMRPPKRKATGYLANSSEWWLPLDTITEDEVRYYLASRVQRTGGYLDMVPALRAALEVKVAEREAEAPFRAALVDALSRETGLDVTVALADDLIRWYKTANQVHRALTEDESKAAKLILGEARRRANGTDKDAERLAQLRGAHPDAVAIARRSSDFVVVVPETRELPGQPERVFARLFFYTPAGKLTETREWKTLTRAQTARWSVLHQSPEWEKWAFNADPRQHYTDAELRMCVEAILAKAPATFRIVISPSKGGERAHGKATLFDGEQARSLIFGVDRTKGVAGVRANWGYTREVTMRDAEPYWETQYWGDPDISCVVYTDEVKLAAATAFHAAALAERHETRRRGDQARYEFMKIETAWEAAELEKAKARFVEDFGDISLWDGHAKTVKLPTYPRRWEGDAPYREAVKQLLLADPGYDFAGLTVRDVLNAAGADPEQVDVSLLDLIPHPKEGDDA